MYRAAVELSPWALYMEFGIENKSGKELQVTV
jgi:hypothetical protein